MSCLCGCRDGEYSCPCEEQVAELEAELAKWKEGALQAGALLALKEAEVERLRQRITDICAEWNVERAQYLPNHGGVNPSGDTLGRKERDDG